MTKTPQWGVYLANTTLSWINLGWQFLFCMSFGFQKSSYFVSKFIKNWYLYDNWYNKMAIFFHKKMAFVPSIVFFYIVITSYNLGHEKKRNWYLYRYNFSSIFIPISFYTIIPLDKNISIKFRNIYSIFWEQIGNILGIFSDILGTFWESYFLLM